MLNRQLTHRTVRTQDFPDFWVLGGLRANRTLLSSVWAAAAVPASVLTAARKLKYSWILRRLSLPIHVPSSGGLLAGLVGFQNP